MKKIGIYGGTFDPIHHGHLILAREAREKLELDQIIFVPAAASPLKEPPSASATLRLEMLQAAIKGQEGFVFDDCEIQRPAPSYSIDTALQFREREPKAQLFWLIGADNASSLNKWHRVEELKQLVQFAILDRGCSELKQQIYPVVQRNIDISATDIRNRVASGRSIRYLVPQTVEEIIRREKLYRESTT
ncbi:MAG TPA: nicotinate-nucleotide adenylyltransferase [Chthoniobacterales bacterium]|nr:nicotinate-nucleotide adenylyltransferase [Chthoniobacterales bacterium]